MVRTVIAIILGYIVIAALASSTLFASAAAVGNERLLDPQTNTMSRWFIMVVEWPVSITAAIIGGLIAALVAGKAQRDGAIRVLAAIMLAFGLSSAAYQLYAEKVGHSDTEVVEAELSGPVENMAELAAAADNIKRESGTEQVAIEALPTRPMWDAVMLPIVGVIGVVLGGRLVSNRRPVPPADRVLQ